AVAALVPAALRPRRLAPRLQGPADAATLQPVRGAPLLQTPPAPLRGAPPVALAAAAPSGTAHGTGACPQGVQTVERRHNAAAGRLTPPAGTIPSRIGK